MSSWQKKYAIPNLFRNLKFGNDNKSIAFALIYKESFFPVSLIFGAKFLISETGDDMVIDNADGLKMGINDRRTYKSEASTDQILTDLTR